MTCNLENTKYENIIHNHIPLIRQNFSGLLKKLDKLTKKDEVSKIKLYFEQNPDLLPEYLNLIKITGANPAALKLYETENEEDLIGEFKPQETQKNIKGLAQTLELISKREPCQIAYTDLTMQRKPLNLLATIHLSDQSSQNWKEIYSSLGIEIK